MIGEREGALDKLRLESEAVKVTMARKDEEVCGVILDYLDVHVLLGLVLSVNGELMVHVRDSSVGQSRDIP